MENEIKEIETSEPKLLETGEDLKKEQSRKKRERFFEIGLYVILGILVGIAGKTEANKRFTVGFDDHLIRSASGTYSINQLQSKVTEKRKAEAEKNPEANQPSIPSQGGYCGN